MANNIHPIIVQDHPAGGLKELSPGEQTDSVPDNILADLICMLVGDDEEADRQSPITKNGEM